MTKVQRKSRQLVVEMDIFKIFFHGIFLSIVSLNSIVHFNGFTNDFLRSIPNTQREGLLRENADFYLYNRRASSLTNRVPNRLLVFEKVPQERTLPEMRTCISWGSRGKVVRQKTSNLSNLTLNILFLFSGRERIKVASWTAGITPHPALQRTTYSSTSLSSQTYRRTTSL